MTNSYSCTSLQSPTGTAAKTGAGADIFTGRSHALNIKSSARPSKSVFNCCFSVNSPQQLGTQRHRIWPERKNLNVTQPLQPLCAYLKRRTRDPAAEHLWRADRLYCRSINPSICLLYIPTAIFILFFSLWFCGLSLSLFSSLPPTFLHFFLRSSAPAPRAFKNLKYFIFPLASNQFQTPPFPAPPPLARSPSLRGY